MENSKTKVELPHDPAIPILGIYLENMKTLIQKDISIPMFQAALFTAAKTRKQPTHDPVCKQVCILFLSHLCFQCAHKKPFFQMRGRHTQACSYRWTPPSSLTPWRPKRKVNTDDVSQPSRPLHPGPCLVSKRFSTLTPFKRTAKMKYTKAAYTAVIQGST